MWYRSDFRCEYNSGVLDYDVLSVHCADWSSSDAIGDFLSENEIELHIVRGAMIPRLDLLVERNDMVPAFQP
jgi:hypothetical protein